VTRDVLARKLDALRRWQVAVDIVAHELAERGTTPSS